VLRTDVGVCIDTVSVSIPVINLVNSVIYITPMTPLWASLPDRFYTPHGLTRPRRVAGSAAVVRAMELAGGGQGLVRRRTIPPMSQVRWCGGITSLRRR
jgi:hypothetical protein